MPSTYAHYRFASEMIPSLPETVQQTVRRFRRLYDAGSHGPDLFFYHNPFSRTSTAERGYRLHRQQGSRFFAQAARNLKLRPSEGGNAYLFGVLTHFALDSLCHPLIRRWDAEKTVSHCGAESEFDRFLLEADGKIPPQEQDLSRHMELTKEDVDTICRFYPYVDARDIRVSLRNMRLCTKALGIPGKRKRWLLRKGMEAAGVADMLIPDAPDAGSRERDLLLMEQYRLAAERFPEMASQLMECLEHNTPLGGSFDLIFG